MGFIHAESISNISTRNRLPQVLVASLIINSLRKPEECQRYQGKAVAGTRFTYAIGGLGLWPATPSNVDDASSVLKSASFNRLAIASPKVAPYGAAAEQVLNKLSLLTSLEAKIVYGENITQAFQFASTGNAELGFVALSQVYEDGKSKSGSGQIVPESMVEPLRQDAQLLVKGSVLRDFTDEFRAPVGSPFFGGR